MCPACMAQSCALTNNQATEPRETGDLCEAGASLQTREKIESNQVHDAYHIIPIIPYPLQQIQQIISKTMRTFDLGSSEFITAIKTC